MGSPLTSVKRLGLVLVLPLTVVAVISSILASPYLSKYLATSISTRYGYSIKSVYILADDPNETIKKLKLVVEVPNTIRNYVIKLASDKERLVQQALKVISHNETVAGMLRDYNIVDAIPILEGKISKRRLVNTTIIGIALEAVNKNSLTKIYLIVDLKNHRVFIEKELTLPPEMVTGSH